MTKKFRPSNGCEGEIFIEGWCVNCKKDANKDCQILADTFVFDVDNDNYPSEWIYDDDGNPKCTAYDGV